MYFQLHLQVNDQFQPPVLVQRLNATFGVDHPL